MSQPYHSTLWFNVFHTFIDLLSAPPLSPYRTHAQSLVPSQLHMQRDMDHMWKFPSWASHSVMACVVFLCFHVCELVAANIKNYLLNQYIIPALDSFLVVRCINRGYGADGVHGAKGTGNIWSPVGICPPASPSSLNVSPTASYFDIQTCASVSLTAGFFQLMTKHPHKTLGIRDVVKIHRHNTNVIKCALQFKAQCHEWMHFNH